MIGTGPYWIKSEVPGSSITYEKNPDYFAFDERFPENRLPYIDEVTVTNISDMTTAMTALRTGKLDILGMLDWRQAATLAESNPELKQTYGTTMGYGLRLRIDQPPFNDINLRKALQMAIDIPLLAETHYGGTVDPVPYGIGSPNYPGWFTPFNEWPQNLRDEYTYNPKQAKAYLQTAGYTPSFPLKFETTAEGTSDLDQLQILKSMFREVGFDMTIKTVTPGSVFPLVAQKQYQTLYFNTTGLSFPLGVSVLWFSPTRSTLRATQNQTTASELEAMIDKYNGSATFEEARLDYLAIEQYCLAQHWDILTVSPRAYTAWSPNLMGYTGETTTLTTSLWIPNLWKK
jgi:peptide/nickel transport system substrate-binding protein